jgi:hypothetical protein
MPLQATSGAASYDAFGGGAAAVPQYIEDVFSTQVYTGSGLSVDRTITNGIDLASKGGIVWTKYRNAANAHVINSTPLGFSDYLVPNDTGGLGGGIVTMTANSDGYTLNDTNGSWNDSAGLFASWTFRKQPKFFDIQTWTGTGANRTISHALGSVPACIMVKRTDTTGAWQVYHRSLANTQYLVLNTTAAVATGATRWNSTTPTSTEFSLGTDATVNASGGTYVAYIFAHNAGGFGLTGTDNVISCGSFTGSSGSVNLGYEPQWLLVKQTNSANSWRVFDNMRGWTVGPTKSTGNAILIANTSAAETDGAGYWGTPTATGFDFDTGGGDYIYIAIRRGPMKVPTSGTSVFSPVAYTGTNVDNRLVNSGIVTDMAMARIRATTSTGGFYIADRLRGDASVGTVITSAESTDADSFMTPTVGYGNSFSAVNGFGVGNDVTRQLNQSSTSQLAYALKRAPQFFDVCAYTGTGSATTFTHNLGAVPEIMIVKRRNATGEWRVYVSSIGANDSLKLQTNEAPQGGSAFWDSTTPTASVFTVGTSTDTNASGSTYINYLFATCAGVSKVGSYTGTGTTKQINCGFTGGARFVLIKRTDATGDWYVWDTARGIVAGNDPYLVLNTVTGEQTGDDYIDTYSAGFELSSTAPVGINDSGGTFIFLAIA